jgi:hypothetical protein
MIMSVSGKKTISAPVQDAPVANKGMISLRKEASVSLKKNGLEVDGTGGVAVYLVLDHSRSMVSFYRNGDVQRITEQALALAAEIDDDGEIPVFYYEWAVSEALNVSIKPESPDYYAGWVDRTHAQVQWGSTNMTDTIRTVAEYHAVNGGGQPGLVIFQTDGVPDNRITARQALKDVSGQNLFFAFVGFGAKRNVDFLFELDQITGRVRDNASAFHAADPRRTRDADLYDGILKEFTADWLPQVL